MKKFLLAAILVVLSTSCATAQYSSGYDNNDYDYMVNVDDDLLLTDRQWHTDDASILEANNNQYLVLRGGERYRHTLGRLNVYAYQNLWGETIVEYRPYYYNGSLGWYVVGSLLNYFIYPDGRWCRFGYRPTYYSYHYPVYRSRCLNLFHWHFWTGRHHHHYRGHCYRPPRRRSSVHYHTDRRSYGSRSSGVRSRSDGYNNRSSRSSQGHATVRINSDDNSTRRSSSTVNRSRTSNRTNSGTVRVSRERNNSSTRQTSGSSSESSRYQNSGSNRRSSSVSTRSSSSGRSSVSTRSSGNGSSRSSTTRSSGNSSRRR